MSRPTFQTETGFPVPSVDEAQMREVDRIATEDFGLGILQMMENAGRNLALSAMEMIGDPDGKMITIVSGSGGNGGGGLAAARHLHNHGYQVQILLSKPDKDYDGPAKVQSNILKQAGINPQPLENAKKLVSESDLILDALIGYSLKGAPRGTILDYIHWINLSKAHVLSLDLPSGVNATTGETPGEVVLADRTVTLALPKPGLANKTSGDIILADIGIPPEVYHPLGINIDPFFGSQFLVKLKVS